MNKTIVIADDNAALCSGMRDFINSQDGFEVVGVAQNGNDACALSTFTNPTLSFLTSSCPNSTASECSPQWKTNHRS